MLTGYVSKLLMRVARYDDSANTIQSVGSQRVFKKSLQEFYNNPLVKNCLKCMITGLSFPSSSVIAAHLLPKRLGYICNELLSLTDINDARNGLLIFRPFEWAFDTGKLSIV